MGRFEVFSDFIINDTLKPHVDVNFQVAAPGQPLQCPLTGKKVYPRIVAAGSGNTIHLPSVFARIIAMTGKDQPNVVYIGTPFFDRDDKYKSGTESFRRTGCPIKRLMVADESTTPSPEEMHRIVVEWADAIVVSGGNSLFAMLRWQAVGLDLVLKEAALKGNVLCGGSAGCGCWFDSVQTDSLKPEACKLSERVLAELSAKERLDWSFVRISGMGYVKAFCIPHLDTVGTNNVARIDIAKKMLLESYDPSAESSVVGLGIDENAAMIYEEGRVTIVSAGIRTIGIGQATCHVLFINERNEVVCIPITPDTGEAVTLDEMIERAKRSVEAVQCPLDLMVSPEVTDACHRRGCSGNIDMTSIVDAAGVASVTSVATMGALERSPPILFPEMGRPPRPQTLQSLEKAPSGSLATLEQPKGLFEKAQSLRGRTKSESISCLKMRSLIFSE